jgi:cytochrome c biogenesis protein ResB
VLTCGSSPATSSTASAERLRARHERDDPAGGTSSTAALELRPGETVDLPNGLGTITFEDNQANGGAESVKRYVSLSIHRDVGAPWVLVFAILALAGLLAALFVRAVACG